MKKQLIFLVIVIIILFSHSVSADQSIKKITSDNYEITYDSSTNLFVYPLEHSIDRLIKIKNIGNRNINIDFQPKLIIDGKNIEIRTWPQWLPKYIKPNDEVDFVMKVEWTSDLTNGWQDGKIYEYPFQIDINIDNNPVKITLNNQVLVEKTHEHMKGIKTNSKISGYVIDASTNKPIENADVEVRSYPGLTYQTKTDSSGFYSVPVRAYQRQFLKNYIQYNINIKKEGYENVNYAVSPKENEEIKTKSKMLKETERAEYRLINKIYTGLPATRVDFSKDYKYFATVPFHSSEKIDFIKENAYLHFFSSNGTLLWKYKLDNEIPTVDVSDDGSLIVTAHRPAVERWNSDNYYIILFNNSGNVIWNCHIPNMSTETTEDGISEVRISHNNKYLAAGTWFGKFYLIDLDTRKILWNKDFNNAQVSYILFKEDDSSIYVGADPYLYNFDTKGNLKWKSIIGSWPYDMDLSKNYIFVGGKAGRFISLFDKNTGNVIWRYPVDARSDNLLISPDESYFVYQSSNGDLAISNAFFNASGNLMFNLKGANSGFITSDSNYMAYYDGSSVHLVNRNGNELWSYTLDPMKWPTPRGAVYISDDKTKIIVADAVNGYVYFFEGGIEKINNNKTETKRIKQEINQSNQDVFNKIQSKTLWQKIIDWFTNLLKSFYKKIRKVVSIFTIL